ncbi:PTS sugar transporter subunit IIB [Fusibacter ferrireducens]|uniref:PTS sugar transporter subunit IIB n=1 Tax=Fusibacter ferrireducens TaxID=2785058 RepID=A0ABS0A026_9FIRM|nr:PTS sugar transporter subunit IIB [Fusibacter ferrireducens]MBF4695778.1 PTS sugar transporter subunit IIB [Fusibacter ferrireducens]
MKTIMVCCGSSMVTSTIAIKKLTEVMKKTGIDAKFVQCKFSEVSGKIESSRPDVIVPTGSLDEKLTAGIPVVRGTSFITGINEKATIDEIIKILSK